MEGECDRWNDLCNQHASACAHTEHEPKHDVTIGRSHFQGESQLTNVINNINTVVHQGVHPTGCMDTEQELSHAKVYSGSFSSTLHRAVHQESKVIGCHQCPPPHTRHMLWHPQHATSPPLHCPTSIPTTISIPTPPKSTNCDQSVRIPRAALALLRAILRHLWQRNNKNTMSCVEHYTKSRPVHQPF